MMRFIRNNAVFVLIVVIFIVAVFIGTIFLVWGRGSLDSSSNERSIAAWVGAEEILYDDYLKRYDNQLEFYRRFYPSIPRNDLEKRFSLKKGALDALISRRLLLDEARRMGLAVSDEEIAGKIRETTAFHVNGVFDPVKYREVLGASGIKSAVYEEDVRGELLAAKVKDLVQLPVQVAPEEVFGEFRRDQEKVRLGLVILPAPVPAAGAVVPEAEARRAFDADPGRYARPDRGQFSHAALLAKDFPPAGEPTADELQRYYDDNPAEFRTEKAVRARHILFKLAEDVAADEERKIRERAQFVLDRASSGADFAALAREFSQDASGPDGGDLGWFTAGKMVPAFEQAAFALDPGKISALIRTQFGLHIIKVEEVRAAGTPPFEQVRDKVVRALAAAATRAAVAARVEQLNDELLDGDFAAVAAKHGLSVGSTGLVPREGPLPGPAARPEVAEALFALREGETSELFRQGEDYWFYAAVARRPAYVPTFEEARAEVESDLLREQARLQGLAEARLRLEDLRRGEKTEALAARLKVQARETALFTRRDFVAAAGIKGELFEGAFDLEPEACGGPVSAPDGRVFLYRVAARIPATREAFAAEESGLRTRLLGEKKDRFFEAWIEDLRKARAVKINEALVGKL